MGGNAQRRRSKPKLVRPCETTDERLRRRMQEVTSLEQFAQIVTEAPPLHRQRLREYLEPMLATNLPCCTLAQYGTHTPGCQRILDTMKAPQAKARFN